MKLQQPFKKSLATVTMFILGVFAVVGLSYAAAPDGNAFKPINEGSDPQGRCVTEDTSKPLDPNHMYSGDNNCISASTLITNGLFIKTPKTTFEIQGDPSSSNTEIKKGAFYVGCSNDDQKYSLSLRVGCGNINIEALKGKQPEAYLNGDVYIYELADSSATTDRRICMSNHNSSVQTIGQVVLCP